MSKRGTLRLATRGSALARRQAALVEEALATHRYDVELVEVETTGDRIRDEMIARLGRTGAFVRALDERVLDGEVDGAIHSMKDMPTESPEDLIVAGIPERATPNDALVTPDRRTLADLPTGGTVGTSSLRRRAQLLSTRSDLTVESLRGNVDTRIEKLLAPHRQREHESYLDDDNEGREAAEEWFEGLSEIERRALGRRVEVEYDAIVLAAAGLARIGLDRQVPIEPLPVGEFVPAPGQGALAVTALDGTDAAERLHDVLDDPKTRVETTVERLLLSALGGGCIAPIGLHAVVQGEHVHVAAQILSTDGTEQVKATRDLPIESYAEAARGLAEDLSARGATELIEAARQEGDTGALREEE